jgi:hypothetical protein
MFARGKFISPPVRLARDSEKLDFERTDIEIQGLEQAGRSTAELSQSKGIYRSVRIQST